MYSRAGHFVLQWWDPAAKGNLSDRVDGDLVAAIVRAREIEERLLHFRSSGQGCRRLKHRELVDKFLQDLLRRADAGEIDPATVRRYRSALGHYLAFTDQPDIQKTFPHAAGANRDFQLALAAFLHSRSVSPNGHSHTKPRRMRSTRFVEDAVRSLYEWAADPDRGHLLPEGYHNPFLRGLRSQRAVVRDLLGEPDITLAMAVDFVGTCDAFQLKLFAPMILYGFRAAEPCFLFGEHVRNDWFKVQCIDGIAYKTKGRRDKRFPILPCVQTLWKDALSEGLCYQRRDALDGREKAPLSGSSLQCLEQEFARRSGESIGLNAAKKLQIRNSVLKDAGGLTYDHIEAEFRKVARKLNWPAPATVKDFRHLFSTLLENAGIPEYYRRYLMGQAPGMAVIINYPPE
jgi:integrase